MRVIVTHTSPDMDAITSVWLIKKFLMGWEDAIVKFVPAGERLQARNQAEPYAKLRRSQRGSAYDSALFSDKVRGDREVIEVINGDEVIHVDTGLGPLDHHQTSDDSTCAAKRAWEWVIQYKKLNIKNKK
mgnify:CR=1 FL=1